MEKERPSKTQKKRHAEKLQKLGESLVALPETEILKMEIPDKLKDAVLAAQGQGMNKHGAKRRQLQFIGSIMRKLDPEPIEAAIANISRGRFDAERRFKALEVWRDEMIFEAMEVISPSKKVNPDRVKGNDDPVSTMEQFLDEYPETERQRLAQLVRNAANETLKASQKPENKSTANAKGAQKMPKSSRTLFRYIREMVEYHQ